MKDVLFDCMQYPHSRRTSFAVLFCFKSTNYLLVRSPKIRRFHFVELALVDEAAYLQSAYIHLKTRKSEANGFVICTDIEDITWPRGNTKFLFEC